MWPEQALVFDCDGQKLCGILHSADSTTGVLIVVGGPQYRVGSHRQFVLLARFIRQQGFECLRFDVRGMGDSEGEARSFLQIETDIRSAIDHWQQQSPHIQRVVIWGLCDGASAASVYSIQDPRVCGLILLNPWVYTEQTQAQTYLKHYYRQRLLSADFWRKLFSLKFDYRASWQSLTGLLKRAKPAAADSAVPVSEMPLPQQMLLALQRFAHPVCLILSGRDLVADEFRELIRQNPDWQTLTQQACYTLHTLDEADHTFSSARWRQQVEQLTLNWLQALP